MQKIILGFVSIVIVLTSGCVDPRPGQAQETGHIQETEQIPPEKISHKGVDVENLTSSRPVIISIDPNVGTTGTKIVITGRGFTAINNNIVFRLKPVDSNENFKLGFEEGVSSSDSETIEFTLPSMLGACAYIPEYNTRCPEIGLLLKPGTTYPVFIVNINGTSNSINFTMT
jgi:hypothetical protein